MSKFEFFEAKTYDFSECIIFIKNGLNIKQKSEDSGIPITRIETLSDGIFNRDKLGYANIFSTEGISEYILEDGDLLMSHINSPKYLGRTVEYIRNIENEIIIHGMNLLKLKVNKNIINSTYARYYINGRNFKKYLNKISKKSVNQASFTISDLKKHKFIIPDLAIQHEIVKILNKIDLVIKKLMNQKTLLDRLIKARFVEMFDEVNLSKQLDSWVKLKDVGRIVGGSTPKTKVSEYWDGDNYWITPAEINERKYIYETERKITEAGVKSCSLEELPINTVILSSRAPIGKVAISKVKMYCNQGFKNIVCSEKLNEEYLFQLLKMNSAYLNNIGRGATFKEISKKDIENLKIPIPSLIAQNQFEDFVKQVDKSKVAVEKQLEKTQMLFDSLMQEFFG